MNAIVYTNGPIVTMEEGSAMPQAVRVEDDRITYVGDLSTAKGKGDVQLFDLNGHTLLPGFIDAHSHIASFASTLGLAVLEGARDFEDIVARMKNFIQKNDLAPDQWIMGFGYDHNELKEGAHPDKTVLDRICVDRPILITHKSGHMGVANSKALALLGLQPSTPNPQGGTIGRMPGTQEPNGYLEEMAFVQSSAKVPAPSRQQMVRQFAQAQKIYASYGITTAQEGLSKGMQWDLLKAVAEQGGLFLDIVSYIDLKEQAPLLQREIGIFGNYHRNLRIGGYKMFLDGSPQGRTAWMTTPYQGTAECGYPIYTDEQVCQMMRISLEAGQQLLVHCNGDAAAQQMIDCYRRVTEHRPDSDSRPVMIHAQLVRPDQLQQMAPLHIIASFFVAHTRYWGDTHVQNFGFARAESISPVRSAIQSGVVYTFHQDTPVLPPNMLDTLVCAIQRTTRAGTILGASERISAYEALKAITIHAAYQYHEEEEKGSIRAGKRADLVILGQNPLEVCTEELRNIPVLMCIKDGQIIYDHASDTR